MKRYLIAEWRAARGLTREELALKSGVGESTIKKIENGQTTRPQPANLDRLAAAFGINRERLTQPPPDTKPMPRREPRRARPQSYLPSVSTVDVDEPGIDEAERQRRHRKRFQLDEIWRNVFDMGFRGDGMAYLPFADRTPMRVRHEPSPNLETIPVIQPRTRRVSIGCVECSRRP